MKLELKNDSVISDLKFANPPSLIIINSFDESGYIKFMNDFNMFTSFNPSIIPIVIDSYGGEAYSLMGMVSIIKNSAIPIVTIMETKAMSCGAVLFSCGHERYMSKYSTILIHDVSSNIKGKVGDLKVDAQEAERLDNIVYELLDENTGQPKGFYKNLVHDNGHADWYLTAKDCLKYNLATKISIPTFTVTTEVTTKLTFPKPYSK
jgi:ATP-dependent Clp protease protease subunit